MRRPLAPDIEHLEIEWEHDEGDIIVDLVVIARVYNADDGYTATIFETTPSIDATVALGLLRTAEHLLIGGFAQNGS
jgi:hypothetical protein